MKSFIFAALVARATAQTTKVTDIVRICSNIQGVALCNTALEYPIGRRAQYCGEVQCGIIIDTDTENVCTAVNRALGDDGAFQDLSSVHCNCLTEAQKNSNERSKSNSDLKYVSDGFLWYDNDDALQNQIRSTETCVIGSTLYKYETGKKQAVDNNLKPKDGWTFVQFAEVDMQMYAYVVANTWTCMFDIDNCNKARLASFFGDYHTTSNGVTNGDLTRMLKSWITLYDTIHKKIAAVNKAAGTVQTKLSTVSSKVNAIKKKVCTGSACKGKTASSYLTKASTAIAETKKLSTIPSAGSKAAKNLPSAKALTKKCLTSATTPASEAYYFNIIYERIFGSIKDLSKVSPIINDLPLAAPQLKKLITPISDFTKQVTRARNAQKHLNGVLTQNWKTNKELSKTASSRKVRDGFVQIQSTITKDLRPSVNELVKALEALNTELNKFPLRNKKLEMKGGAVSYQRWVTPQFKAPCVRDKTKTYELNGYTDSITYKEVYACSYGPTKINFMNHHIPYIGYRFV